MKTAAIALLTASALFAAQPLAQRIVHTDHSKNRPAKAVHGGAGELHFQTLLGRDALVNLNFVHRGMLQPNSSIGHHFHNTSDEMFLILDSGAEFTINGRTSALAGPVGVPSRSGNAHAVRNPTGQPMEWMNINVRVPGPPPTPGAMDPTATFDLGDDRVGAPLDAKPQFITARFARETLRPVTALNGGKGTARYRRLLGPSMFVSNWAYVDHLVLAPGSSAGRHVHPGVDEFYYVLDGEGTVGVGDETASLRRWDGVPIRMGEVHSIENGGSQELEIIIVGIAKEKGVLATQDVK